MTALANNFLSAQALHCESGVCTTANSNYTDTPTNSVAVFTAGANGSLIRRVTAVARANVTATELQLFRDHDGTGTAKRFFRSKLMAAYTVAQITENVATDFGFSDDNTVLLNAGEKIWAAIGVSNTGIVFNVEGYDL